MNNRIDWVDDLKAIAIFFVLWGHFASGNEYICRFIYSFHMPLFFLISGFLFKPKNNSIPYVIKLNAKTLLLPYVVFAGAYTCYRIAHQFVRNSELGILEQTLYKFLCGDTAWYLTGMFFCKTVFNYINRKAIIVIMIFYTLSMPIIGDIFIGGAYFNWIPRTLLCIPFFLFGYIIKTVELPQRKIMYGIIQLIILFFFCSYFKVGPLSFVDDYKTLLIFILQAFLGIMAWYNISVVMKIKRNIIFNVSSLTLLYYTLHYFILDIVNILKFHIKFPFDNVIISFCIALTAMFILYKPSLYILKNKPELLGK